MRGTIALVQETRVHWQICKSVMYSCCVVSRSLFVLKTCADHTQALHVGAFVQRILFNTLKAVTVKFTHLVTALQEPSRYA